MKTQKEALRICRELMKLGAKADNLFEAIGYRIAAASMAWACEIPFAKLTPDLRDGIGRIEDMVRACRKQDAYREN